MADLGLDGFYQRREQGGLQRPEALAPPPAVADELAAYDGEAFRQRYVRCDAQGTDEVEWAVAGMHCAACVWLLEALPRAVPGLQEVRVDFARGAMATRSDPARLPASQLAATVARLGYRLRPWGDPAAAAEERRQWRRSLLRVAVAAASAMGAMHLSLSLFAGHASGDMEPAAVQFFGLIACLVALPGITWAAGSFYRGAIAGLLAGRFTLDATVAFVLVVGMAASFVNLLRASPELYVDALAMFVALLLAGRLVLQASQARIARHSAWDTDLLPLTAWRLDADGRRHQIASEDLLPGEVIAVEAGGVLPCDGRVLGQAMACDSAILTGEPRPLQVSPGGMVYAGCRNVGAAGRLEVVAVGDDSRLGGLLAAVRRGEQRPTPLADLLERVQAGFAPVVSVLAIATALLWWWWGTPRQAWDQAIAIVLVACPCALGLASPLTQSLAGWRAARRRIFIRDGGALELLVAARHVVLDKTGTLTEGRMRVVDWRWAVDDAALRAEAEALLCAAEAQSGHPVAAAIEAELRARGVQPAADVQVVERPGAGLSVRQQGVEWRIGNAALLERALPEAGGATVVGLQRGDALLATIQLADPLRPGLSDWLSELAPASLHILSGDSPAAVAAVAAELGIERWQGGCSPEDKAERVRQLAADGPTVVVGDGVNDCLALQAGHVGIAIRGGLEAAVVASGIYCPAASVATLRYLWRQSRRAVASLRRTLGWAVFYNLVAIAFVVAGWWGPYVCAIAMPLSSLAVIGLVALSTAFRQPLPAEPAVAASSR